MSGRNASARSIAAKWWSFTLNNYTQQDLDRLSTPNDAIEYIIYGKEVGASGTPHLQGTVCFHERLRRRQVTNIIGQAHFTVTRFLAQSIDYCKKDGDFLEVGTIPKDGKGKGRRSDLEDFKASVKEGLTCEKELREVHSSVCALYPRFVKSYIDDLRPKIQVICVCIFQFFSQKILNSYIACVLCVLLQVEAHALRPWQETLYQRLIQPPDKREIIFIVDLVGNQGKSWFSRYFCDLHENAMIIVPGKKADMAYVVREDVKTFFMDCPRSKQGEFIQYDFLEELKNGYLFSPKYESRLKRFNPPHVVVFMNEPPDRSKLSRDRYSITNLT